MAVPTTRFRTIPSNTLATALDLAAKRTAAIAGESVVSVGVGNELDFGVVAIDAGAADSPVKTVLWDVTADGGNTVVDIFLFWLSSEGWDQAGSVLKYVPLSGADNAAPVNTENYLPDATPVSYTFVNAPVAEPGAQNIYPTDEGASMALATNSDDVIMWAEHVAVAANETTGTYKGTDAGYEFQHSFKYSYS